MAEPGDPNRPFGPVGPDGPGGGDPGETPLRERGVATQTRPKVTRPPRFK